MPVVRRGAPESRRWLRCPRWPSSSVGRGQHGRTRRMPPGEKHVQQHAQGVDVRGGRDRAARHLLRRGVLGRQRRPPSRVSAVASPARLALEQLGDAEVEQLHLAVASTSTLEGLMSRGRSGWRARGRPPPARRGTAGSALPSRGRCASQYRSIGSPSTCSSTSRAARRRDAGVDQVSDVGMGEAGQDAALAPEALLAARPTRLGVEQLHRGQALEAAVAAPGEPHAAHAALPMSETQRVGADRLAGQRSRRRWEGHAAFEETFATRERVRSASSASRLRRPASGPAPAQRLEPRERARRRPARAPVRDRG